MQRPKAIQCIKLILTAAVVILLQNVAATQKLVLHRFTLKGYIKGKDSGYVYINYIPAGDHAITDSCPLIGGHFVLTGNIAEPTQVFFAGFSLGGPFNENNCTQFYIEPCEMKFYAEINNFKTFTLNGSTTNEDFKRLIEVGIKNKMALEFASDSLRKYKGLLRDEQKNDTDDVKIAILQSKIDLLNKTVDSLYKAGYIIDSIFIAQNPNSYVAAKLLSESKSDWMAFVSYKRLYNNFSNRIKHSFSGKLIKHEIEKETNIYVGGFAENFVSTDSNGDTISLAAYKDKKYVLLDFSASWCVPCRQIIPSLKKEYAKYDTALEIISIAKQDEVNDWRNAIKKDEAPWPQIIENNKIKAIKPINKTITDTYYVDEIPALVLIDENEKIVGKYGAFYSSNAHYMVDLQEQLNKIFVKQ